MKRQFFALAFAVSLFQASAQVPAGQTPPPTADPYANNPDAGKMQFPLAAPKGKDTGAIKNALPGGVNQGPVDPATWKYGPNYDVPGGYRNTANDNIVLIEMIETIEGMESG